MESDSRKWSVEGRIGAAFLVLLITTTGLAVGAARLSIPLGLSFLGIVLVELILGIWMIRTITRPLRNTLEALKGGIDSFADRDFSMRLVATRTDELGDIVRCYNTAGKLLQQERNNVRQKELLLATALNRSPVGIVLVNSRDRVTYANIEARRLLLGGDKLDGRLLEELIDGCPEEMKQMLGCRTDGMFSVRIGNNVEYYHIDQRSFQLNQRPHRLISLQLITHQLNRQEAQAWKKVIRVVCHELNNSLAPVSSLIHSAKTIAGQPEQHARFEEIFSIITDRLEHLQVFIEGYAKFARLPEPRREQVPWSDLLAFVDDSVPIKLVAPLPNQPGYFDRSQLEQLIVNLVKNAVEASDSKPNIEISIRQIQDKGVLLEVMDRGRGMDEETIQKAVLPFYSTKKTGSGLGLPLCREIIEAHGGHLDLQTRSGGGTVVACWLPETNMGRTNSRLFPVV